MTAPDRRPPPITVTDPAKPGEPLDLLIAGPQARPRRRLSRRTVVVAAAAAVVAATALVVDRRAGPAVELSVGDELSAGGVFDRQNNRAVLELLMQVRNDGTTPVTLLRGGAGGYGLAREVTVAPDDRALVVLTRTVACGDAEAPVPPARALELTVRPRGDQTRRVRLPLPYAVGQEQALQACGCGSFGTGISAAG